MFKYSSRGRGVMRLSSASAATRHVAAATISILKVRIPMLQRQGEPHMTVTMEKST